MDVFFLTMGAAMVLAMHAGFAFLEVGTVRKKIRLMHLSV
jgi:Amt family ammonium transporter